MELTRDQLSLKNLIHLMRATNKLEEIIQKDLRSIELTINEFGVLELLYHRGKQTTRSITDKILVAKSSMTYVIDCLVAKGYVQRMKCKEDRRVIHIDLTESGRALIDNYFPKHTQLVESCYQELQEQELVELHRLLGQVRQSFDSFSTIQNKQIDGGK
ncbi:MarR family winged helix-turn-helix transcriptional regulator [Atopobacter phocae]|uniref:MarR family winged helix-turn-helix transcriptional regulator n=1 Tax=Atopobacter phocae TaxID=136492 RepID=UPI00047199E5|nr:MarR family transcriptional regulator [Atopobacter phocae]